MFLIGIQNVHLKATSSSVDINKLNNEPLKGMDYEILALTYIIQCYQCD